MIRYETISLYEEAQSSSPSALPARMICRQFIESKDKFDFYFGHGQIILNRLLSKIAKIIPQLTFMEKLK